MFNWLKRLATATLFATVLTACVQISPSTSLSTSSSPVATTETTNLLATQPAVTQTDSEANADATLLEPTAIVSEESTTIDVFSGQDLALEQNRVLMYPAPRLVAGDQATFLIYAQIPDSVRPQDVEVQILVDDVAIVDGTLGWRNLAGEAIGLFEWVWDTSDAVGEHELRVVLDPRDAIQTDDADPDNNEINWVADVAPADALSKDWVTSRSAYATLHVIAGSAAERDIDFLSAEVDTAILEVADRLNMFPPVDLHVYFSDRVIGNGGYAGAAMVISYPDRNYAGGDLHTLLVHETVHLLDNDFEPGHAFRFLVEGLAVWVTGGHYQPEDLDRRAAALYFETDKYIPLTELVANFYPSQHEIGYLEAGSFFKFLIGTYGWDRVRFFYTELDQADGNEPEQAMSAAMQTHFGKTLQQLENDWLVYLRNQSRDDDALRDLALTIQYYDTMRLYQQEYDPTVYFLDAWLPTPEVLTERRSTAELMRRPNAEINVWLETMLISADKALRSAQYDDASALLNSIERVIRFGDVTGDPLAGGYLNLVRTARAQGYIVRSVDVNGDSAIVHVVDPATNSLAQLHLSLRGQEWVTLD